MAVLAQPKGVSRLVQTPRGNETSNNDNNNNNHNGPAADKIRPVRRPATGRHLAATFIGGAAATLIVVGIRYIGGAAATIIVVVIGQSVVISQPHGTAGLPLCRSVPTSTDRKS